MVDTDATNFFAARRAELRLTQRAVAAVVGCTDKAVAAWEANVSFPRRRIWPLVAEAYQVTINEIAAAALATAGSSRPSPGFPRYTGAASQEAAPARGLFGKRRDARPGRPAGQCPQHT